MSDLFTYTQARGAADCGMARALDTAERDNPDFGDHALEIFKKIGTYILASEPGTSLTATGWRMIGTTPGRSWSVPSRPRVDTHPLQERMLFEKVLA